jgi:carboxymethylenebutenolidase
MRGGFFLLTLLLAGCGGRPTAAPPRKAPVQVVREVVGYHPGKETLCGLVFRPASPAEDRRARGVVVVPDDSGLTETTIQHAKRLARKGHVVLAIDLYRGKKPKGLEEAHILDRALPEKQVLADLAAAVDHLNGHSAVRKGRIGILGWGSGGGYALDAGVADRRIGAVITCYGRLRTDPESLKSLRAPVLAIFAGKDRGITPDTIEEFKSAMKKAGKRLTVHVIPQARHGFMEAKKADSEVPLEQVEAWRHIDAYLQAALAN